MPLEITSTQVNEGSTCKIEFQLLDYNENGVAQTNITAATFTLKDRRTSSVINNRDGVNNGSDDVISNFDSSGNFSLTLVAADNVICAANRNRRRVQFETHVFTIYVAATVDSEDIVIQESIEIKVADLRYKP